VFVLFIIVNGLYFILKSRLNDSVQVISFSLFGLLYISVTISFIFKLRGLPYGAFYIWFVSVITVMTDVGGYFIGKFFGRHKINLPVSPKKTWEGYIGSFLFQFISVFIFYFVSSKYFAIPSFSHIQLAIVSILIFSTSVFGDLFESLIKRNASIKDSGQFLPGHGGLLDRIDSIMFSLPVFYFYLTFFR
jgi:phosphatidate cytidylyltransferase